MVVPCDLNVSVGSLAQPSRKTPAQLLHHRLSDMAPWSYASPSPAWCGPPSDVRKLKTSEAGESATMPNLDLPRLLLSDLRMSLFSRCPRHDHTAVPSQRGSSNGSSLTHHYIPPRLFQTPLFPTGSRMLLERRGACPSSDSKRGAEAVRRHSYTPLT